MSEAAACKAGGSTPWPGRWAGGKIRVLWVLSCGRLGAGACQPCHAIVPLLPGELPRSLGCGSQQERHALPSETRGIGWRTRPLKKITSTYEPRLPPLAEVEGGEAQLPHYHLLLLEL